MTTADGTVVGTTQVVNNGPRAQRWNLVLLGDGYQVAQLGQYANDVQAFVDTLFATPPFDELRTAINVFRVDVSSTDSGADDPAACGGTGAVARTYFDASFCNSGARRLLLVNNATALSVAGAQVPEWHMVMVIVNSTVYGGAGGAVATFSVAPAANEIALHEMGHTAFGLADEYEYFLGCGVDTDRNRHPAVEPTEPNVTIDSNRNTIKWRDLIAATTSMPTTTNADCTQCDPQPSPVGAGVVGAFEGAHYFHCAAFRPEFNCRMRALNDPFCAVCTRRIRQTLQPYRQPTVSDIVGFGDAGVYVALSNGDGNFDGIRRVVNNFAYSAGGWRVERHPRFLADITGDRRADIVGFGDAGVYVALSNGDGNFDGIRRVVDNFAYSAGGWRVERHPRFLADITGDRRADVVGFGDAGVYVALSNGDGNFDGIRRVIDNFAYSAGGWRVERHPRFLADITGDGRADVVGFGDAGVFVALSNGDGSFQPVRRVIDNFAYSAGGWRVERHPRFLADITGDGRADVVGFGDAGVFVALSNGDGSFQPVRRVIDNFAYSAGGWRVERHPRFLADITGDGRADIVGFGDAGVFVALSNGDGSFQPVRRVIDNFAYSAGGWRVERHPRFLADIAAPPVIL